MKASFYCSFFRHSEFPSRTRSMSTAARRRLMGDFKRMQSDPPEGIIGGRASQ
jgi:hypothetical protein